MVRTDEAFGEMTTKDALAVVFVSLGVLSHYRECLCITDGPELPLGLLKMALAHLDSIGANTEGLRLEFKVFGMDFGPALEFSNGDLTSEPDSSSAPRPSRSRIPYPVKEAIRAKHQAGWSKSRIAREFRLNRRTVIRICRRSVSRGD